MALGTFGSTLNDELNRLANGGTYRTMGNMVDEALAAKQWANRENINPYSTDTVGILNEIAGLGLDKKNWLDFNGVCNYIAGTTGLPAAAALRQVYPTTDLLTGVASYYVDAAYPTGLTSTPGYVYINGVIGNGMITPDATTLDITGDIDIRVRVALDNWTNPSVLQNLLSKANITNNNLSYIFQVDTNGTLRFVWTVDGVNAIFKNSTVATNIPNGAVKWVRVAFDVNNGASGNDVFFYTSDDGTTWTQLGTTVTTGGTTSIFSGSADLAVGGNTVAQGAGTAPAGKYYRAQVLNGIGGTVVLDADMSNVSQTATSFTALTGQTVTINGFRAYPQDATNLGAAGSLLPTTLGSSTAADSNDPKFLDFTGTNYVYLPGVAGNFLSVPDESALDITGDIDLRAYVALDDWTPAAANVLISKFDNNTVAERAYELQISTTGAVVLVFAVQGGSDSVSATSTVVPTITDGQPLWVRATLDVDNGAGGYDVKFFTSTDGTNWTQLGATVTGAGTVTIRNSGTEILVLGRRSTGTFGIATGKYYRAQIFNGIDGTKILDVDTSVITAGSATSFTALTDQTVTINRSTSGRKTVAVTQPTWLFGTDDYMEVNNRYMSSGTYLYLPGVAGNYASTPDAAALDITGDIDLRCKVAMDDWTPAAYQSLIAKRGTTNTQVSYQFGIDTNGTLVLGWSSTGGAPTIVNSTVAPTATDGSTLWVRATFDVDNGASGRDIIFYTSTDGTNWTQLGATVTQAGTTSIFSGTAILNVGAQFDGGANSPARAKFFRAQVLNGIDGTVAFDANFETSITSLLQTSFTESSANSATVTINRSGSTYRSAGITAAGYLYPGATNTFSASATDFLNFGASDNLTALVLFRNFATPAASSFGLLGNQSSSGGVNGWQLRNSFTTTSARLNVQSGATSLNTTEQSYTLGSITPFFGIFNRATNTIQTYVGTTASATVAASTVGNITSYLPVRIGAWNGTLLSYDGEIYAAAVFRQALTASQIRQISNYFANREVYL